MAIDLVEQTVIAVEPNAVSIHNEPDARERLGRRWLIWSFILCPCHLPITLGVLGVVFGGSAFGAVIKSNGLGIGIALTSLYAIGLTIGLRHIHTANKDRNCSDGSCFRMS